MALTEWRLILQNKYINVLKLLTRMGRIIMKLKLKILAGIILASIAISGIFMLVFENAEYVKKYIDSSSKLKTLVLSTIEIANGIAWKTANGIDAKAPYVEYDIKNQYYQGLALKIQVVLFLFFSFIFYFF